MENYTLLGVKPKLKLKLPTQQASGKEEKPELNQFNQ